MVRRQPADPKGARPGARAAHLPLEALRAVTIHAARQYFLEQDRGSIAVGKRADFVVLNADPVTAPPAGIRDIQVLETVKNGEPVWSRECP